MDEPTGVTQEEGTPQEFFSFTLYNCRCLVNCFLNSLPPVLSTCPLHTNSGCGKERRISIGPW